MIFELHCFYWYAAHRIVSLNKNRSLAVAHYSHTLYAQSAPLFVRLAGAWIYFFKSET